MATCQICGVAKAGFLQDICAPCTERRRASPPLDAAPLDPLALTQTEKSVTLTTAPSFDGFLTSETLEIIKAECVFGMNIFKDILAGVTDVVGGRSDTSQRVLRDAKEICLVELRREAAKLGANAVIAVSFSYNEISGGGKSMLFLVASGTAVVVERVQA